MHGLGFFARKGFTMTPLNELTHTVDSALANSKAAPTMPYDIRAEIDWLDFSCTANPLGAPDSVRRAVAAAVVEGDLSFTPNRDGSHLANVLGRYYEMPSTCFLAGTSTLQMIRAIAQTYRFCNVAVPMPCPASYLLALTNAGHNAVKLATPFDTTVMDPSFAFANDQRFTAAVLANPAYPTGRLLSEETLLKYLDACDWVIVDESHIKLSIGAESFVNLVSRHPNLLVVRSLSTDFGMPGIPMGYIVGSSEVIARIAKFGDGGELGMFHELVARQLPSLYGYELRTQELLESEIPWMQCMLSLIPGIKVCPSESNFVMCTLLPSTSRNLGIDCAHELISRMQKRGFTMLDLTGTPGVGDDRSFLVCVRSREDNQAFLDALKSALFE